MTGVPARLIPSCARAQLAMIGCGALIVGGLALAVFGAVWAVRNHQNRRARQASMARHPARGTWELA
jgi:hypothetical protein